MNFIREKSQGERIFLLGFSLGANIMSKYLGEEGDSTFVTCAMGVCNPYSFTDNQKAFEKSLFGLYDYGLANNIKHKYMLHYE